MKKTVLSRAAISAVVAMIASVLTMTVSVPSVAAAAGDKLVFLTQPSDASGGTDFGVQPVVEVLDADDVRVDTNVEVSLTLTAGSPTGALTCPPVLAVSGLATFAGCQIDLAGPGYALTASATGIAPGDSAVFGVTVGEPAQVGFLTQPTDITSGAAFAAPPSVALQDAGGNQVDSAGYSFGLVAFDDNDLPLVLSGCTGGTPVFDQGTTFHSVAPQPDGTGHFPGCTVTTAGTNTSLLAVAVPSDPAATALLGFSDSFDVSTGAAERLVFVKQPGSSVPGEAFVRQPVVAIVDSVGNVVGTSVLDVTVSVTGGGALTCAETMPLAATAGVATFTGCLVNSAGAFTLTATAPGLIDAVSRPFSTRGGQATSLAFTTQPGDGTGGVVLATQPVIEARDAAGLLAEATIDLTLEPGASPGILDCSNTTAPAGLGVATYFGCRVDAPGTYQVRATELGTGVTVISDPFTIVVGPSVQLAITDAPVGASAGASFPVTVEFSDAAGNLATQSGDSVRIAFAAGVATGGARLTCDNGATETATAGVATFSACSVDKPGTYRLAAVSSLGVDLSDSFPVTLGAPAAMRFISAPTAAIDGGLFGTPQVRVTDAGGNPVNGVVSVSLTNGTLSGCTTSAATSHGTASFPGCTLETNANPVVLRATVGPVTATRSVPVQPGPIVGTTAGAAPLAQTFGGRAYANNPSFVTNNVNSATGALQFSNVDLAVAGIGVSLDLTRSYNSADTTGGSFGPGWTSIFDAGVTFVGNTAVVRSEDGQQVVFEKNPKCKGKGTCEWIAPASAQSTLSCRKTECTVERFDGLTMVSVDGKIKSYTVRKGEGLDFWYKKGKLTGLTLTTDGDPFWVGVTSNGSGQIERVATPTRATTYSYAGGQLTNFVDANGNQTSYSYSSGRLTGWTLGLEQLSVSYSPDGRVAAAAHTGQQRRFSDSYEWSVDGAGVGTSLRHSVVRAHGVPSIGTTIERSKDNVLLTEETPDGATTAYSFDEALNLVAFQDPMGEVQRNTYSDAGDLIRQSNPDGGVVHLTYDSKHRVVESTDANGNTTEIHYSGVDVNWVTPPDPTGPANEPGTRSEHGTHFKFDRFGNQTEVATPLSVRHFTYDRFGNQTGEQIYDPADEDLLNPITGMGPRFSYDEAGNLVSSVDARGVRADGSIDPAYETTFTYDAVGRRTTTTTPDGHTTTTTYTPAGDIASTTVAGVGTTVFQWSEASRTKTATGASTSSWTFDDSGNLLSRRDASGRSTESVYDLGSRLIEQTDPANVTIRYTHNAMGVPVAMSDSFGHTAETAYDTLARPVRTVANGLVTSRRAFDVAGNLVSNMDAEGRTLTYTYNNHGLMESVSNAAGTTSYTYDADDRLASVTDGNGQVISSAYDPAGRRIGRTVAGNTWSFDYDDAGNLVSTTDPDQRTTSFTLDPRNQRTQISYSQPGQGSIAVAQQFNAAGQRTRMVDPTGTHTFGYDAAGNMTSAASPTGTFLYDYSTPGFISQTYPDGTVVETKFDDAKHVMRLTAPDLDVAYLRNSARQVTGIATGNGLLETRGYDGADRLVSQDLRCGASSLSATRYGYDNSSNPLGSARVEAGAVTTIGYGYDGSGRLAAQTSTVTGSISLPGAPCPNATPPAPGGPPGAPAGAPAPEVPTEVNDPVVGFGLSGLTPATGNPIGYDAAGNRTSAAGASYAYDAADRLTSSTNGRSATFDASGNMTSSTVSGATTQYRYDAASRLAGVTLPSGASITYRYDGDGNRVTKALNGITDTYAWDRTGNMPLLALETSSDGSFRRFFYGVGPVAVQTNDGTFYFHTDRSGNVTSLTDGDGALVTSYAYDGFGQSTETASAASPDNPMRFAGQFLDSDTGLYNLRARNYDPTVGRFTQRDPVITPIGAPVVSPYAYANNQPTVLSDLTGAFPNPTEPAGHSTPESNWVSLVGRSIAVTGGLGKGSVKVGTKVASLSAKTALSVEKAAKLAKYTKNAGRVLGAIGIGVAVFVAVDDCMNGTMAQCVGSSVGLAFTVGCLAISSGVGSIACALAGAALSWVISEYGEEIWGGLVVAYEATVEFFNDVGKELEGVGKDIGTAFESAGLAIADLGVEVGNAIATGFNDLGTAIASGYRDVVAAFEDAGKEIAVVAVMLRDTFSFAAEQVAAEFVALGHEIEEIGIAIGDFFAQTPALAAKLLNDLGYEIEQVAVAIGTAFEDLADWTEEAAADVLRGLGYALDEVSAGLEAAYDWSAEQLVALGATLNYAVDEIGDALQSAYDTTAAAFGDLLDGAAYTANQIAAGLESAYNAVANEVSVILKDIGHTVEQVAKSVETAFNDAADWSVQALADALDAAGYAAEEVAQGLENAVNATADAVASVLKELGYTIDVIGQVLEDVLNASVEAVSDALQAAGYAIADVANTIGVTLGHAASAVVGALGSAASAVGGFISNTASAVVKVLDPTSWF